MTERTFHGQRYVAVEIVPHTRRDGSATSLTRWLSWCATCGEPFFFTSPTNRGKFEPNRRCQRHKRPGQRVRSAA